MKIRYIFILFCLLIISFLIYQERQNALIYVGCVKISKQDYKYCETLLKREYALFNVTKLEFCK